MSTNIANTDTYTNGAYKIPEDDDAGTEVFVILEDFMKRMAIHTHTGADSAEFAIEITKKNRVFEGGNLTWVAHAPGGVNTGVKYADLDASADPADLSVSAILTGYATVQAYTPVFTYWFYDNANSTDQWKPFMPEAEWQDADTLRIFSNVQHTKIRISQI